MKKMSKFAAQKVGKLCPFYCYCGFSESAWLQRGKL